MGKGEICSLEGLDIQAGDQIILNFLFENAETADSHSSGEQQSLHLFITENPFDGATGTQVSVCDAAESLDILLHQQKVPSDAKLFLDVDFSYGGLPYLYCERIDESGERILEYIDLYACGFRELSSFRYFRGGEEIATSYRNNCQFYDT